MHARPIHLIVWAPIARGGLDQIHGKPLPAPRLFGHPRDLEVQTMGRCEGSAAPGGLPAL
jgi:hypothetical protein